MRLCRVGEGAGAALALGIAPRSGAFVAWCAYLSFVSTGREFVRFQWDALLLESGLEAFLGGRHGRGLMRLLAFRLQFESDISKLASRDATWRDLSGTISPGPCRSSRRALTLFGRAGRARSCSWR